MTREEVEAYRNANSVSGMRDPANQLAQMSGSDANRARAHGEFIQAGGSEEGWNTLIQQEDRDIKTSRLQSAGLRAEGNAEINQNIEAEKERLNNFTLASPNISTSSRVQDISAKDTVAKQAENFDVGFTQETKTQGYVSSPDKPGAPKETTSEAQDRAKAQGAFNTLTPSVFDSLEKEKVDGRTRYAGLEGGSTTDPYKSKQPDQSLVSPYLRRYEPLGYIGNDAVQGPTKPNYSYIGYGPNNEPVQGPVRPDSWSVLFNGKEKKFKTKEDADEYLSRTISIDGKDRNFKTKEDATKFLTNYGNAETINTPIGSIEYFTREQAKKTTNDQFKLGVEKTYNWLGETSDKIKNYPEAFLQWPITGARVVLGGIADVINLTEEYVDPKIASLTGQIAIQSKPIEKKFETADQTIIPIKGLSWSGVEWKSKEEWSKEQADYITKHGGQVYLAANAIMYGKTAKAATESINFLKLIKVPVKVAGKQAVETWIPKTAKTTEGISVGTPIAKTSVELKIPSVVYALNKISPVNVVSVPYATAKGTEKAFDRIRVGYGPISVGVGGRYGEVGAKKLFSGSPEPEKTGFLTKAEGAKNKSSFDVVQTSHYTGAQINEITPIIKFAEENKMFVPGGLNLALLERTSMIARIQSKTKIAYEKYLNADRDRHAEKYAAKNRQIDLEAKSELRGQEKQIQDKLADIARKQKVKVDFRDLTLSETETGFKSNFSGLEITPNRIESLGILEKIHKGMKENESWLTFSKSQKKDLGSRMGSGALNTLATNEINRAGIPKWKFWKNISKNPPPKNPIRRTTGDVDVKPISELGGDKAQKALIDVGAKEPFVMGKKGGGVAIGEKDGTRFENIELKSDEALHGTSAETGKKIMKEKGLEINPEAKRMVDAVFVTRNQGIAANFATKQTEGVIVKGEVKWKNVFGSEKILDYRNIPKNERNEIITKAKLYVKENPGTFEWDAYQNELLKHAQSKGYTGVTKPYMTYNPLAKKEIILADTDLFKPTEIIYPVNKLKNETEVFNIVRSSDELVSGIGADTKKYFGKNYNLPDIEQKVMKGNKATVKTESHTQQTLNLAGATSGWQDSTNIKTWAAYTEEIGSKLFPSGERVRMNMGVAHRATKDIVSKYYFADKEAARIAWEAGDKKLALKIGKSMNARYNYDKGWIDFKTEINKLKDSGEKIDDTSFKEASTAYASSKELHRSAMLSSASNTVKSSVGSKNILNYPQQEKSDFKSIQQKPQSITYSPRPIRSTIIQSPLKTSSLIRSSGIKSVKSASSFGSSVRSVSSFSSARSAYSSARSASVFPSSKYPSVSSPSPKSPLSPSPTSPSPKSPSPLSPSPKSPSPGSPSPRSSFPKSPNLRYSFGGDMSILKTPPKRPPPLLAITKDKTDRFPQKTAPKFDWLGNTSETSISGIYNRSETTYGKKKISKYRAFDFRRDAKDYNYRKLKNNKKKSVFGF